MLYIKNSRLYTASFSFALPEGMSIDTDSENLNPDTIAFKSLDGLYEVAIGVGMPFNKGTPTSRIAELLRADCFKPTSEIMHVVRGGMSGLGLYYQSNRGETQYYEEFLEYPENEDGQTTFELCIIHRAISNQNNAFVNEPIIKELIESIKYEPKVCKKVINS